MQPLNAYKFYELGGKLHSLFDQNLQRVSDMFTPLTEAQTLLDSFIKNDQFTIQNSRADATRLLNKIGATFNRYFIDPTTKQLKPTAGEERIDAHELSLIRSLVEKFEHALGAELNHVPAYVAEKCGIYSTYELAENAQQVFGANLRGTIPASAQMEFNTAGRALAFGLGTAATIHILRSIDIMLKTYYESFAGSAAAKGERNYASYIKKLMTLSEEEDKDPRPDRHVLQMLAQIKDQYRNPLVTPEKAVETEEAAQLFGMASTLISLMARQILAHKPSRKTEDDDSDDDGKESFDFQVAQAS